MNWLDEVTAAYGEPHVKPASDEGTKIVREEGLCWRRAWVWFPTIDGHYYNHHVSIDRYVRGGRWVVTVGSHVSSKGVVEFRTSVEPDEALMQRLLATADFLPGGSL